MTGSTITTSLSSTVTLTNANSPLNLTATGTINTAGTEGVYASNPGYTLINQGVIAAASEGVLFTAGGSITNGGTITGAAIAGLSLNGIGAVLNTGLIQAGTAAAGTSAGSGIILGAGTTLGLSGNGHVLGGAALDGAAAGTGAYISLAAELLNHNKIYGGNAAAYASGHGGTGGTGVEIMPTGYLYNSAGNILNVGKIHGGTGGASSDISGAGAGGTGVYLATSLAINDSVPTLFAQGTLANNGLIIGGTGGYGSGFAQGGNGGAGMFVAAAGSVTNNGVIEGGTAGGNTTQLDGAAGQGVYLANYADLTNTGDILGATGQGRLSGGIGVYAHGPNTIINQYSISGGVGGSYSSAIFGNGGTGIYLNQSVLINNSRITGGNAGGNNIQTATPGYGGTGVYINGGTVINTGTIAGGQSNGTFGYAVQFAPAATGTLEVLPTAVFIGNVTAVAGQGDELLLENTGGSLSGLGTQFSGFDEIAFAPGAAWQISGSTLGLETSLGIAGFTLGDTITLTGITGAGETETYSNGELTLASGGSALATLSFSGEAPSINSGNFAISTDGTNTTIVAALCYLRGTLILTPAGERPIEDLRIGDLVVTKFGGAQPIKWIGRQRYDARFLRHNPGKMPVCIRAGALGADMPARDLYISPGHSMLLDKTLVLASHLINGITITQDFERDGVVDYFQLEFSGHDCVIAEGAWGESYADGPGLRGQFHNMADYHALYPDEPAATGLKLCADRPERGPDLARALVQVVARAAAGLIPGPLEGFIDHVSANRIEGWALDQNHPDLPVTLDILWRGRILGSILACDGRDDLAAAGKGRGRCAFFFTPSESLPPESWAEIELRRGNDTLPRSEAFQVSKKAVLF